jgi:pimeloyl-ACP methyl ester carboxylesterase
MKTTHCLCALLLCLVVSLQAEEEAKSRADREPVASELKKARRSFGGFEQYEFKLDGHRCIIVKPATAARGKPWIWRARFFGHQPQADIALLKKGFHIAYIEVGGLFGNPAAVERWNLFYGYLTREHGLSSKVALEGMSRGGLIIYNWAGANPEKVSCIYGDAPVCDFRSWPGDLYRRKENKGEPLRRAQRGAWAACLKAYGLSEEQVKTYKGNPVDNLEPLAKAGIPLLHVCGGADKIVPVAENTAVLEKRYKALGGSIKVILKKGVGHHPHSLKDPEPIVSFVLKHSASGK